MTFTKLTRAIMFSGDQTNQYVLCLLYGCVLFLGGGWAETTKPNIVFILADDLGWNDVSFHGYSEIPTPNIDRLAKEGVILNSYYAQYVCTPSRTALMTGKYPIRTGLHNWVLLQGERRGLSLKEKLLPQYLQELHYKTHMIGKWHLGYSSKNMTPTNRGFDSFFGIHTGMNDYYNYTPKVFVPNEHIAFDLWHNSEPARHHVGQYATELFTEKAVERINDHDYIKPLFLYVAHLAPHFANEQEPMQAPQKYIDRFPHIKHKGRQIYAGMLAALDDSVGEIFDALVRKNVSDNTILIFASDNGGGGAEQGVYTGAPVTYGSNWPLRGARTSQWEGGVRVAAFVWSKLLEITPRISNELYHVTDWLPTFYKLGGGTTELLKLDGHDIWPSLSKALPSPREELLIQASAVSKEYALRWKQFKLISGSFRRNGVQLDQWYEPEGFNASYITNTPGRLRCGEPAKVFCEANVYPCLFDLNADPCEIRNLANENPNMVEFLWNKVVVHNASVVPTGWPTIDPLARAELNDGLVQPWLLA